METMNEALPNRQYRTIAADPPWPQRPIGRFTRHCGRAELPYKTLSVKEIRSLAVSNIATQAAHLWLWTTNRFLHDAFHVLQDWGFTYLTTVTWVKPSGFGAWFANTTQHCLFGYFQQCRFPAGRYLPTHFTGAAIEHSRKPDGFYDLVRAISPEPRIDLFNRRNIEGFDGWGDESPKRSLEVPHPESAAVEQS